MNLIDVQRRLPVITAFSHPRPIMKSIVVHIPDNGSSIRTKLHAVSIRITMINPLSALVIDPVLVHHSRLRISAGIFPEVSVMNLLHGAFLPLAELPDHGYPGRGRRECSEYCPLSGRVSSEIPVRIENFSSIKSIKIHLIPPQLIDSSCFFLYNINRLGLIIVRYHPLYINIIHRKKSRPPTIIDISRINNSCLEIVGFYRMNQIL